MRLPSPEPGLVLSYIYLWRAEAEAGRDEGVKLRPSVIVLSVESKQKGRVVVTLPITHSPPRRPKSTLEVPAQVKAALGLDEARSWVVIDEANMFDWPGHDVRRAYADEGWSYGFMPPGFFRRVREAFMTSVKEGRLRMVQRT